MEVRPNLKVEKVGESEVLVLLVVSVGVVEVTLELSEEVVVLVLLEPLLLLLDLVWALVDLEVSSVVMDKALEETLLLLEELLQMQEEMHSLLVAKGSDREVKEDLSED